MEFIKLFEPIVINGKLEVKNRIVLPALGLDYTRDYSFNERYKGFYRARAPSAPWPSTRWAAPPACPSSSTTRTSSP